MAEIAKDLADATTTEVSRCAHLRRRRRELPVGLRARVAAAPALADAAGAPRWAPLPGSASAPIAIPTVAAAATTTTTVALPTAARPVSADALIAEMHSAMARMPSASEAMIGATTAGAAAADCGRGGGRDGVEGTLASRSRRARSLRCRCTTEAHE